MLDKVKNDYYFNLYLNLARATYIQLEKHWDREARVSGLTYAQQHALWLLHVQDGLTLTELGNIALWNKSTTSEMVSRLEKKGLIKKVRGEDSRSFKIYLSDLGYKTIENSTNSNECVEYMSLLRDFDEEELIKYLKEMQKLLNLIAHDEDTKDFDLFIDEYSKNLLK